MTKPMTDGVKILLKKYSITLKTAEKRKWVRWKNGRYTVTAKGNKAKQGSSSHPTYAKQGRGIFGLFDW